MKTIVEKLSKIITDYTGQLNSVSEETFILHSVPGKWSRKEELGHLIDSAHSNLRRFVVAQYEVNPKIVYNQDFWNHACNYQHQSSQQLITLWQLLNQQIAEVLHSMPETNYKRTCDTGKGTTELHSLEWLADDYVKHLLHHLHHILSLEEIPY